MVLKHHLLSKIFSKVSMRDFLPLQAVGLRWDEVILMEIMEGQRVKAALLPSMPKS